MYFKATKVIDSESSPTHSNLVKKQNECLIIEVISLKLSHDNLVWCNV